METYTLLQLNGMVRQLVESTLDGEYWVEGELLDARVAANGHFYGELVQKEDDGRVIVARARVNCWARQFAVLHMRFRHETGETLRSGIRVRILVRITFHEQYGYALNMLDADTTFTMGDMLRRRREILRQLEADGILDDNKTLALPRLTNRIAVVSSETAAGYGDFRDQLLNNPYGLRFEVDLYPALMQGAGVTDSIMQAFDRLLGSGREYHAIVVIRGGGATGDLSDFDSYPLACLVAQSPLPVIVGIGHDRDETVLDYVAHTRVKTPTAAASFLVDHQLEELSVLGSLVDGIYQGVTMRIERERERLSRLTAVMPMAVARVCDAIRARVDVAWQRMATAIAQRIERESHRLDLISQRLSSLDPERLLRLGYSITLHEGRIVRNVEQLSPGDVITTRLEGGTITSTVQDCAPRVETTEP